MMGREGHLLRGPDRGHDERQGDGAREEPAGDPGGAVAVWPEAKEMVGHHES
jgi:hypothetical protein